MTNKTAFLLSFLVATSVGFTACSKKDGGSSSSPSTEGGGTGGGGGGGGTTTPVSTTQGAFRVIFVTATSINGTGVASGTGSGVTSMDALCASEATTKGLGGVFKAMVYASTRNLTTNWVLRAGKEYRREDLTTVIGIPEDVVSKGVIFNYPTTPLTNTFTAAAKFPWTGFKEDWTFSLTCSNWTESGNDGSTATMGAYGKSSIRDELVDLGYTQYYGGPLYYNADDQQVTCNKTHPIYCVQTRQLPPPGAYKRLFRSTTAKLGDTGLAGFDATCAADAATKGLTGTYKAVIGARDPNGVGNPPPAIRTPCTAGMCAGATGMSQAVDWTLLPNTVYRSEDGKWFYGKTNAHGMFVGELEEPLPVTDSWTGLGNGWVPDNSCVQWSTSGVGGSGTIGNGGSLDGTGAISGASVTCSWHQYLLCAEQ